MSAPGLFDQAIAAFALHAVWQVPLLAGAAWMAARIGRPSVRVAHVLWVTTLLLSVAAPMVSTWQGYCAARARAQVSTEEISFDAADTAQNLPAMQRESPWLRLFHKHFSAVNGVKPFAFALPPRIARSLAVMYMLLFAVACMRCAFAWRRARNLARSASTDVAQTFVDAMQAQCWLMECDPPRVAVSDEIAGPLLAGVSVPTLLLPASFTNDMNDAELEAVLTHELSHLRRRDPLWHAACSVMLLPVQFHPVARWIAGRVRQTREMACDAEAALWMGSSSRYASALLSVAERIACAPGISAGVGLGLFDVERKDTAAVRDGRSWSTPGHATAGLELFNATGAMEERMQSMMKHDETMGMGRRWTRSLAAAVIAASGVVAACMIQVQPTFAAQQATLAQPQPDHVPSHVETPRDPQALQVITDDHGSNTAVLKTQTKDRVVQLRVQAQPKSVEAIHLRVQVPRNVSAPILVAKVEAPVILVEQQEPPRVAKISAGVMAGQIITKTQPVYPQSSKDAKISGSVVLHAIVDETGKVEKLDIVSSPDKDLSRSAIEAVQHWTYKPYLLNGRPTAVDTTITVNYSFAG